MVYLHVMTTRRMNLDYVIFFLLGTIWGTNFLLMKIAGRVVSPLQVTWLRVACGALPILALAAWRGCLRREHLRHLPHFAVLAIATSIVPYLAFARGTQDLKSGAAGAIAGVVPLLTAALASLVLPGERLKLRQVFGMIAGGLGVALVAQVGSASVAGEHAPRGLAFMLCGAMGYAVAVVYQRRFVTRLSLSPLALACYQTLIATLMLTLITPTTGLSALTEHVDLLLMLTVGLGVLGTGFAFIMYYHVIERLGAVTASSVFYLPPVSALLVGALWAGEWISVDQASGVALILLGVWLARARPKHSRPKLARPRSSSRAAT